MSETVPVYGEPMELGWYAIVKFCDRCHSRFGSWTNVDTDERLCDECYGPVGAWSGDALVDPENPPASHRQQ